MSHLLYELHYTFRVDRPVVQERDEEMRAELGRILDRGGWIVPRFALALGWSARPFLVHVLSLPLLADDPPESVKAWRRAAGNLSYSSFEEHFRQHGAPPPKQVLDLLRMAGAAVWAARQRKVPERRRLARHLGYSSERYLGRRVKQLSGLTAGQLARLPVDEVVQTLSLRLRKSVMEAESSPPSGRGLEA